MYGTPVGNKLTQILEIIERNRWEKIRRLTDLGSEYTSVDETDQELSASDVEIVLFGAETPFSTSMITMISQETVIALFSDPEKAIDFCCCQSIQNIIIDIDSPTDSHHALDVYTVLKILNHDMRFFICSKRQHSLERDYFEKHHTQVIMKPVLRKQVMGIMNNLQPR